MFFSKKKGFFVVVYGIDGVGKTTTVLKLEERFKRIFDFINFDNYKKELQNPFFISKEKVLQECSDYSQFCHYVGSNIFQGDLIRKLLTVKNVVVKSRWFLDIFGDFSYRGLKNIEDFKSVFPFLIPDLSVLLVVDEKERQSRINKRGDKNEKDLNLERSFFLKNYLLKSFDSGIYNDNNFLKIDSTNKTIDEVVGIIFEFCLLKIKKKNE